MIRGNRPPNFVEFGLTSMTRLPTIRKYFRAVEWSVVAVTRFSSKDKSQLKLPYHLRSRICLLSLLSRWSNSRL